MSSWSQLDPHTRENLVQEFLLLHPGVELLPEMSASGAVEPLFSNGQGQVLRLDGSAATLEPSGLLQAPEPRSPAPLLLAVAAILLLFIVKV